MEGIELPTEVESIDDINFSNAQFKPMIVNWGISLHTGMHTESIGFFAGYDNKKIYISHKEIDLEPTQIYIGKTNTLEARKSLTPYPERSLLRRIGNFIEGTITGAPKKEIFRISIIDKNPESKAYYVKSYVIREWFKEQKKFGYLK